MHQGGGRGRPRPARGEQAAQISLCVIQMEQAPQLSLLQGPHSIDRVTAPTPPRSRLRTPRLHAPLVPAHCMAAASTPGCQPAPQLAPPPTPTPHLPPPTSHPIPPTPAQVEMPVLSLSASQGDGEGQNEMNASMDLLRKTLVRTPRRLAPRAGPRLAPGVGSWPADCLPALHSTRPAPGACGVALAWRHSDLGSCCITRGCCCPVTARAIRAPGCIPGQGGQHPRVLPGSNGAGGSSGLARGLFKRAEGAFWSVPPNWHSRAEEQLYQL
jgi:hypothetical protein